MKPLERIYWIAAVVLLIGIISILFTDLQQSKNQVTAVQGETKLYKNKYGELVAERAAFVGSKQELKQQLEQWKQQGDTLRNKLTSKTEQLIYLKKVISVAGAGRPVVIRKDTTIVIGAAVIDSPSILIDTVDKYHSLKVAGNQSRYAYQMQVFDNSELVAVRSGKGTQVKLINRNPHVVEAEVKALFVEKNKTSIVNKVLYMLAGVSAGFLIFK